MHKMTAIVCSLALAGAIAATSVTHAATFGPRPTSTVQPAGSTTTSVPLTGAVVAFWTVGYALTLVARMPIEVGDRPLRLDPDRADLPAGFEDRVFDR